MYKDIAATKMVIQERTDRAERARLAATCRRERRSRHDLSEQTGRFADRLDS